MGFAANFICFSATQEFRKSVKIWQNYRQFKGGTFLRRSVAIAMDNGKTGDIRTPKPLNQLSQNLVWVISSAMWPTGHHANIQTDFPAWFLFFFLVCDPNFSSHPETKPENRFLGCLIHSMSVPGYCIPGGIKVQIVFDFPNVYSKTPTNGAWMVIFKPNIEILKLAYYRY